MPTIDSPRILLNSGHQIPQLGFGLFRVAADDAERITFEALEVGYRHLDTAASYGNEAAIGRAIAASGVPREDLFVTTKLFIDDHGYESALAALPASLERLGLDFLDLYLIHWPAPDRDLYVDSWRALEDLAERELTRSIGVCNFLPEHLDRLMANAEIVPAVNQVELHPAFQQRKQQAQNNTLGITTEAWAPLGQARYSLDELPGMRDIMSRHGKTAAQVVIRWHLQERRVVFPKTVRRDRMLENSQVFDFVLSDEEMVVLRSADRDFRVGSHPRDRN
jgi:2,5-diketo-D-gluconate reductase A